MFSSFAMVGDEVVEVIGSALINGEESGWYQIEFEGMQAYVYSEFLSEAVS